LPPFFSTQTSLPNFNTALAVSGCKYHIKMNLGEVEWDSVGWADLA
jgi:hypothetical protein